MCLGIPDGLEAVCWLTSDGAVKPKQEFSQVFWSIWNANKMVLPSDDDKNKYDPVVSNLLQVLTNFRCFIFELLSPHFRRVALHDPEQIVLLGARDLESLAELDAEPFVAKYHWQTVKIFPAIKTAADAKKFVTQLDPFKQVSKYPVLFSHSNVL